MVASRVIVGLLFGACAGALALGGCGVEPKVGISEPRVYTGDQVASVQDEIRSYLGKQDTKARSFTNLAMYDAFLRKPQQYEAEKSRLDELLEQKQQTTEFERALVRRLTAKVLGPEPAPPTDSNPPTNTDGHSQPSKPVPSEEAKAGAMADSPFDLLERQSELYRHFFLRLLQPHMDARRSRIPKEDPQNSFVAEDKQSWRYYTLYFTVGIDPGTKPNQMAGVRLRLAGCFNDRTKAQKWLECRAKKPARGTDSLSQQCLDAMVVGLHPNRQYDVDDSSISDKIHDIAELAAAIDPSVNASVQASVNDESSTRKRFISRLPKTASFEDATKKEFGWDFFPTSLLGVKPGILPWIAGALTEPESPASRAFLEPGGRTCVAWVLAKQEVRYLAIDVSTVTGPIPPAGAFNDRTPKDAGSFIIPLLPDAPKE